MLVNLVYFTMAWTVLFGISKADKCWMSSYSYHYAGCFKWALLKENGQECTEIYLAGHSTVVVDRRRVQIIEVPFLSTNRNMFADKLTEDHSVTSQTPESKDHGITEYPSSTVDFSQTIGYETLKYGNHISTMVQSLESYDLSTNKDYTSKVDAASTSSHKTSSDGIVSPDLISTTEGKLGVSFTGYQHSISNSIPRTVDKISNDNNLSTTWYQRLNNISTTVYQQPNNDNMSTTGYQQTKTLEYQQLNSDSMSTTGYQQPETTGYQQLKSKNTSTTWYQQHNSDKTSTKGFQHLNSDSISTTGYQQPDLKNLSVTQDHQQENTSVTEYQLVSEQTSVPRSSISVNKDHASTDHQPSENSMSSLDVSFSTSFNVDDNDPTTEQFSTPKTTPALTYLPTKTSTVKNSQSILPSQATTTRRISTLTDNFLSITSKSTTSAYCKSTSYKTDNNGVSQIFFEIDGEIQHIQFQAKSRTGIRIALLTSLTIADFVEVKIGGKANDRSEIRGCSMGTCVRKKEVNTPQYLTSEEFREFWIAYTPSLPLAVGRNNEESPFMQWTSPPVSDFKYIAFSTDDYKDGEFRPCLQDNLVDASPPCPDLIEQLSCICEIEISPLSPGAKICHCVDDSTGKMCLWLPKDCDQLRQKGVFEDGIYIIYPVKSVQLLPFHVYCNMTDDGGWTMLQRRIDGRVNFDRDYQNYLKGFGNLGQEFWLGNEKIFHLTNQNNYTLRINMVLHGGIEVSAEYDAFRINDENDDFRLVSLGSFTISFEGFDAMALCLNMGFTTLDHDVDTYSENCASRSGGGWWYEGGTGWCYHANLNGIYGDSPNQKAIIWYIGSGTDYEYLVKYVDMKIRPTLVDE